MPGDHGSEKQEQRQDEEAVDHITPAYAIPIYLHSPGTGSSPVRGAWAAGASRWTAVVWVAVVTVLFCLPQKSQVTLDSMNYAVIALAVVLPGPGRRVVVRRPALVRHPVGVRERQGTGRDRRGHRLKRSPRAPANRGARPAHREVVAAESYSVRCP
jgi:hypothetical protein